MLFIILIFHNSSSWDVQQNNNTPTSLHYSELTRYVWITCVTQVQRKLAGAMKLSSLYFNLFIFSWKLPPGGVIDSCDLLSEACVVPSLY